MTPTQKPGANIHARMNESTLVSAGQMIFYGCCYEPVGSMLKYFSDDDPPNRGSWHCATAWRLQCEENNPTNLTEALYESYLPTTLRRNKLKLSWQNVHPCVRTVWGQEPNHVFLSLVHLCFVDKRTGEMFFEPTPIAGEKCSFSICMHPETGFMVCAPRQYLVPNST